MRYARQNKILEIIETYDVETQGKLVSLLREHGHDVTQATISRDIKELHLIKILSSEGKYRYAVAGNMDVTITDRFAHIFRETVKSVAQSGNLIIIKTLPGCANAAGEAIDSADVPHLIGSVAGDNTLMVVVDEPEHTSEVVAQFNRMLD